jgi:D-alanyl-D-alanine carboxypeptidase/D-alanyl-D-alanine-endopeptidase (penicillin-binding protein 4)
MAFVKNTAIFLISGMFALGCGIQKSPNNSTALSNIEKFAQDTLFKTAQVGFILLDEKSGEVVERLNEDKYLVPASNTKLFTTYGALKYLKDSLAGFFYRETPDTLYIKPSGDPTFLNSDFKDQKMFDKLVSTNKVLVIEKVVSRALGVYGSGWSWANLELASYPERTVMPIYGNMVRFRVRDSKVVVSPSYFQDSLRVAHDIVGKKVRVVKNADKNTFVASTANTAVLARAFTIRYNPSLPYHLLQDTLKSLNKNLVIIEPQKRDRNFWRPFNTHKTADVVRPMMHDSNNFLAEQLLSMVGGAINGFPNDALAIANLKKNGLNVMSEPFHWADGSGLSRSNQVTPRGVAELLVQMKKEFGWERVADVLQKGNQGTVKGYYQGYENNIYSKTGTLGSNVLSLSGYLITKKGNNYVFSMIVNNHYKNANLVRKSFETYLKNIIDTQ